MTLEERRKAIAERIRHMRSALDDEAEEIAQHFESSSFDDLLTPDLPPNMLTHEQARDSALSSYQNGYADAKEDVLTLSEGARALLLLTAVQAENIAESEGEARWADELRALAQWGKR